MDKKWAENMRTKYCVASRRMVSKILGLAGYPITLGLFAVKTMVENARTSTRWSIECEGSPGFP